MRTVGLALLAFALTRGSLAHADTCSGARADWIEIQFELGPDQAAGPREDNLQHRILEHLQAEFSPRGIDVCNAARPGMGRPLAMLKITRDAANATEVRAWANDTVTHKELSRRLSLEGLPADAHALAIALGASELVSASWAELRLDTTSGKRIEAEAPTSVREVVAGNDANASSNEAVAIRTATEAFSAGLRQFGFDAALEYAVTPTLKATTKLGARSALVTESRNGSVAANGWLVGLGVSWTVARPTRALRFELEANSDLIWLEFNPVAAKKAVANSASGVASWTVVGVSAELALAERATLDLGMQAGTVILPLVATDAGNEITGISGVVVAAYAGVEIPF